MDAVLEKEYLQKIAKGDQSSFELVFLHYHPKLIFFVSNLTKDDESARDLVQDIFFIIWSNRHKLVEIESFKSYIFKMAKNSVYDHLKKNLIFDHNYDLSHDELLNDFHSLSEIVEAKDLELLIDIAVEGMPPQQKNIFKMSRKEGLKNEEIASQLNIAKRTVEIQISNSLRDLRKVLSSIMSILI